jgi:hypothetical protein
MFNCWFIICAFILILSSVSFIVLLHVLFPLVVAMAGLEGFHIFGEEVQMNHGEDVNEVQEVQPP